MQRTTAILAAVVLFCYLVSTTQPGRGKTWRSAVVGLGTAVYKSDDVTVTAMIDTCIKNDHKGTKQISTGPDCYAYAIFFLFKMTIYSAAVASGVVELRSVFTRHTVRDEVKRRREVADEIYLLNATEVSFSRRRRGRRATT